MVAEASVREEALAEDATPDARAIQKDALMARQRHMEEVEDVALRNIERAADRIRTGSGATGKPKNANHWRAPAKATSS